MGLVPFRRQPIAWSNLTQFNASLGLNVLTWNFIWSVSANTQYISTSMWHYYNTTHKWDQFVTENEGFCLLEWVLQGQRIPSINAYNQCSDVIMGTMVFQITSSCLFNRVFRRRSKKTSKLRVTGLCEGNSPVTGEFPAQRASNAENVSIWWRHHGNSTRGQ